MKQKGTETSFNPFGEGFTMVSVVLDGRALSVLSVMGSTVAGTRWVCGMTLSTRSEKCVIDDAASFVTYIRYHDRHSVHARNDTRLACGKPLWYPLAMRVGIVSAVESFAITCS